jgi:ParB family transcriptional regulator, chromosome partitioning protein
VSDNGVQEKDKGGRSVNRRPHGLGRGLSALLGEVAQEEALVAEANERSGLAGAQSSAKGLQAIEIASISPHPDQPRRIFEEEALAELAESISRRGVIQPIIVRPVGEGRYQIVAGERRWRAAQRAQLHRIPAIVRDFDEAETLEIALVENIQRQDLNPIEEARAYARLMAEYGHSQEALGRLVGKSRSHVANLVRLLDLPETVQNAVQQGQLTMGHARALVGLDNAEALAAQAITKGLSVRQMESIARRARGSTGRPATRMSASAASKDADIAAIERHLADLLGVQVEIRFSPAGSGTVTLGYSTLDQLDMLCQRLTGEPI